MHLSYTTQSATTFLNQTRKQSLLPERRGRRAQTKRPKTARGAVTRFVREIKKTFDSTILKTYEVNNNNNNLYIQDCKRPYETDTCEAKHVFFMIGKKTGKNGINPISNTTSMRHEDTVHWAQKSGLVVMTHDRNQTKTLIGHA